MVEKLLTALRALAAPASERQPLPQPVARADVVAREYADAWLTARQCPGLEFTLEQTELLDELDEKLASLDRLDLAHLSSTGALAGHAEWTAVRGLARRALACLGQSMEPPASLR